MVAQTGSVDFAFEKVPSDEQTSSTVGQENTGMYVTETGLCCFFLLSFK